MSSALSHSLAKQYKAYCVDALSNLPSTGELGVGSSKSIDSWVSDSDIMSAMNTTGSTQNNPAADRQRKSAVLQCDPREVVKKLPLVTEVHELLGTGSFSQVFRCKVSSCSDEVAVKVPTCTLPSEKNREQCLLKQLGHPNLVRLLDTSQVREIQALVLELCSGGSLTDFLHKDLAQAQRFGLLERIKGMLGIVYALDYLHDQNIVHRDVKSSNCFFSYAVIDATKLPPLKLGDMGLARMLAPEDMSQGVGTVRYMAPEVMISGSYGLGADIYSVGVMLHEMISGQRPYVRENLHEAAITIKVVQGLRPSLDLLPDGPIGSALRKVLVRCWAMADSMRPSAPELIANLDHIQTLQDELVGSTSFSNDDSANGLESS